MSVRGQEDNDAAQGLEEQEAELACKRVYDEAEQVVDFRKKRVTDTGLNKRITLPDPVDMRIEVKIQDLVNDLGEAIYKAGREEAGCLRAGKQSLSTLTDAQQRGRTSILARERAGELIIVLTDKSGKRAVMTPEMYKELMEPHIAGDTIHTRSEVDQAEKHFNGAAAQILKVFRIGEEWGHENRLKSAYSARHNMVPSLSQLVKDHKDTLKTRPVCRARADQAPNGPLAALVGDILDPFVREIDRENRTEVISTEELCHETEVVNERIKKDGLMTGPFQRNGHLVIGSKDAEAFYPNLDMDVVANEAKLEIMESKLEVKGLDTEELALFLACSMTQEEIDQEGLSHVVHKRRNKKGPRPGLTCKAITGGTKVRSEDGAWIPPSRKPGSRQLKRMVGCLVKTSIGLVMKNHYYSYQNQIRKQAKGGAIGNSLTEKLGKMMMKRFDKKNLSLLKKLKVETEMSKTYVDDNTVALKALDAGVRFDAEKIKMVVVPDLVEGDLEIPEDIRTMNELKKIANTVYNCVQFTYDCPSKYVGKEGEMPVLDVQMNVEEDSIKYEFYEKPCASGLAIPASSAHSKQMKLSVMVEEGLRRLRNNSRGLDWEKRRKVMEDWSRKLKRSGYKATFRHQVIKAAVDKWERMCKDEDEGRRPIHRAREWQMLARRREKESKREAWHKAENGQVSAPLILDPTAGGLTAELRKICDRFEKGTNMRVVTKERAGMAMRQDAKSEPFRRRGCSRDNCLVCKGGKPGNCEKNNSAYRIRCNVCKNAHKIVDYEGETGCNCYSRGLEHQDGLRNEQEDNPLWKHCTLVHGGDKVDFTMTALGSFRSCLKRQVNESVRISSSQADILLNSKSEFHQAPLTRLVAFTGLHGEQGEDQAGQAFPGAGDAGAGGRARAERRAAAGQ